MLFVVLVLLVFGLQFVGEGSAISPQKFWLFVVVVASVVVDVSWFPAHEKLLGHVRKSSETLRNLLFVEVLGRALCGINLKAVLLMDYTQTLN